MKTNLKENNTALKALLFSSALFLGTFSLTNANPTTTKTSEEPSYEIEIQEVKELPSITLVDKNLQVVAQFFGKPEEVKRKFEKTFEEAELLSKYNSQSIYVVVSQ